MDPTSLISPALAVTVQMAKLGLKMAEAPEEIRVVCNMTNQVYRAFREYLRLSQTQVVKAYWQRVPEQKKFVDESIKDILSTLKDIGSCMEPARLDKAEYDRVRTANKLSWAVMKREMALIYQKKLEMDHAALLHHIDKLHTIEATVSPAPTTVVQAWITDDPGDAIVPPWKRREVYYSAIRTGPAEPHPKLKARGDNLGLLVSLVQNVDRDDYPGPELQRILTEPLPRNESRPGDEQALGMSLSAAYASAPALVGAKPTEGESVEVSLASGEVGLGWAAMIERRRNRRDFFTSGVVAGNGGQR